MWSFTIVRKLRCCNVIDSNYVGWGGRATMPAYERGAKHLVVNEKLKTVLKFMLQFSNCFTIYFNYMQNKKNNRIDFANTLRGFAALAVVISHYYGVFWLRRPVVEVLTNSPVLPFETHPTPVYVSFINAFSLFDWGAYGVALFFIISGFVIPFSLQKTSWLGFAINRVLRIVPTYIVGFSITLIAVLISSHYFSRAWPFTTQEILIHYIPGVRDILWSRVIDGVVWTLEIEMKFYFVCALLIALFRKKSIFVFFAPIFVFIVSVAINKHIPGWAETDARLWQLAMTFMTVSQYIIYMFIGVVFHYIQREQMKRDNAYLLIGILFCLFCLHWYIGQSSDRITVAWSYAFALLTFTFAFTYQSLFKSNKFFDFLADISYSLYVIHGVAGYAALRILLDLGMKDWVSLLIVTSGCVLLSWILHKLVEKPSQRIGKKLAGRFIVKKDECSVNNEGPVSNLNK
ncbi:acyltransferase family protein [Aeromonas jandaei]|uniref:acyltransferase family protein n=1 Tax=Aeromonas jandaei TaxID=650 RepID=UPI003B9EA1A9